jgi:hypothetical protein
MSMLFGFFCLAGAITIFICCIPRAVKDSGMQRTVALKNARPPVAAKCEH